MILAHVSCLLPYFVSMFQIDLKKMPLGKLSKKQISSAYGVLTELTKVCDDVGPFIKVKFCELFCSSITFKNMFHFVCLLVCECACFSFIQTVL